MVQTELNENQHTGRQDIASPDVTVERSDPLPVDMKRGKRLMGGIALVALVFVAVILMVAL